MKLDRHSAPAIALIIVALLHRTVWLLRRRRSARRAAITFERIFTRAVLSSRPRGPWRRRRLAQQLLLHADEEQEQRSARTYRGSRMNARWKDAFDSFERHRACDPSPAAPPPSPARRAAPRSARTDLPDRLHDRRGGAEIANRRVLHADRADRQHRADSETRSVNSAMSDHSERSTRRHARIDAAAPATTSPIIAGIL